MPISCRRDFLKMLSAGAATAAAQTPQRRKPNFVVIVTDDQGIGDVGCYGHPDAKTPNLDRLAASGVRFTQWYANAPVCSASRTAIMTGKYPDRAGVQGALPPEIPFFWGCRGRSPLPSSGMSPEFCFFL